MKKALILLVRLALALLCLYFFVCSLSFLATAFRLLSGRHGGKIFGNTELLQNPVVGVMLGVLSTVLVQSSSTTTSIIVGMVASDILKVKAAIPMVMGANIGTSVTNTIVSITQMGDRAQFSRAFACAVVHDVFNWLTVIVLLIVEVVTGFLERMTSAIVAGIPAGGGDGKGEKPPDILKAITKPFTSAVIQIDKKVLKGWSLNDTHYDNVTTLLKKNCKRPIDDDDGSYFPIGGGGSGGADEDVAYEKYECGYVFANWGIRDLWIGIILLAVSLLLLTTCLILLVKILKSLMENQMAQVVKRTLNAEIPYVPWLTGYIAIGVGAVVTFLVQSSSVFTSTLTPLVGTGLIELHRAYPLTLGSNIGTTTTGILAALAADGDKLRDSLQIALCHTFFNISGIFLFYVVPIMRWPIPIAKTMGETVARYRWFAILYLVFMFFLLPLYTFGLSLIGPVAIYVAFLPLLAALAVVVLINVLQEKRSEWLPRFLRSWDFLPEFMRSLDPLDRIINKVSILNRCCPKREEKPESTEMKPSNEQSQTRISLNLTCLTDAASETPSRN